MKDYLTYGFKSVKNVGSMSANIQIIIERYIWMKED